MLKKLNICKIIGIGSLCLFLLGCSEESFLVQEKGAEVITEETFESMIKEEMDLEQKESDSFEEQISSDVMLSVDEKNAEGRTIIKEIAVHICGAVNQPGVYYLQENQRLYEAIAKAGGFRENADEEYLNQALVLEDGMKIVVPTKEEIAGGKDTGETAAHKETAVTEYIQNSEESQNAALEQGYIQKKEEDKISAKEQKVNLNTADEALLCTLPGIGESRAKSIIAYRQEHGAFERTEDVMNISGIKEAAYNKIKDYITVSE